jgi:hypothetical protein
LRALKKQIKGVDRVFLETDRPESLDIESNQRLRGSGEFRTPQGWQNFTFTCDLNPETGKSDRFQNGSLESSSIISVADRFVLRRSTFLQR